MPADGHTLLNGQVCTVQEVMVNKMKLYAPGIGAFWTSFQSWSLIGPSESSSEPSFGVFRNSKCLTCLSPSALYKKKGDKICSKCEEQLSEYWSDEAMEVIIHRNSEFVGIAEESSTSLVHDRNQEKLAEMNIYMCFLINFCRENSA